MPLAVALRDYASVPLPSAPEDWVFDIARRAMEAGGIRFADASLFASVLTSGYFVLILDGANEEKVKAVLLWHALAHNMARLWSLAPA